ncbi:UNVERIFIED_CONTAM: Retrovirus-related Pol polyprotein from transposon.6 [Sesamum calycinum]|uniref:Retrovirus-related Pol polyprotein from transposon.6 n=1 Tax=Sesamum calycinum TaxID=2727403 RepID=A0AAW2QZL0_9LAMI
MCDASNHATGAVLGQRVGRDPRVIYYVSRMLDTTQSNYTTTEKELLAIVFALEKFHSYLLGTKLIAYSDHAALKYLLSRNDAKLRLIRWMLLLQEFDLIIKDKKRVENLVADHLSRLINEEDSTPLKDEFPDEHLFTTQRTTPWYADLVNFLTTHTLPNDLSREKKEKIKSDAKYYVWYEPYLWKYCSDQIIKGCVPESEISSILEFCHDYACGRHFGPKRTALKTRNLDPRDKMPLAPILVCEIFDVWGIDFMGSFPSSFGKSYIILGVDYVSKYGMPRAIISDRGTRFCKKMVSALLMKYNVTYRVSTAYHLKQMVKLRFPTERSHPYLKQRLIQTERIGALTWMMHYGPTARHTRP